jgi:predicted CXXCH cytochrome family protein
MHLALPALAMAIMVGVTACGDDIVFKARPPFNPPPDSVAGFLGYYAAADGKTTCGNCHADEQVRWAETAHAGAWETLQGSGHAQSFCEPCHTVGQNGNPAVAPAGYAALTVEGAEPDSAQLAVYQDVQCESCHGAGSDHIAAPGATQPLASGLVTPDGCGDCHNGTHHPFVEQWSQSAHAIGGGFGYAGPRSGCDECHNGKAALVEQFGVTARYANKDDGEVMPHTCIVCHDPHDATNPAQLRAPINEGTNRNLCVKCHNRETVPSSGTRGAHAAQGPLVLGEGVGWWPPGFEWLDGLTGTHGDPDKNERLCATCHVEMVEITDESGNFVLQSVGHLFQAIPCLDDDGIPVVGDCAVADRKFTACATCHGSESNARSVFELFRLEVDSLLDVLWEDTNDNAIIDATDGGLFAALVAGGDANELNRSDTLFTAAEGALFNAQVAATHTREVFLDGEVIIGSDTVAFSAHRTSGNGVHNPPYIEALLKASISYLVDYYGLPAPANIDLTLPPRAEAMRP